VIVYEVKVDGDILGGAIPTSITRRKNGAASFSFKLPNHENRNAARVSIGSVIKFRIGDGALPPVGNENFIGFVPPQGGLSYTMTPQERSINVQAVDLIGALNYERILINTTSTGIQLVGDEIGTAVNKIISSATTIQNVENTQIDTSGIRGLDPTRIITEADDITSDYSKKLSVINKLRSLYSDITEYPDPVLGVNFYMQQKTFHWVKEQNLNKTPTNVKLRLKIGDKTDGVILSSNITVRPFVNKIFAISSVDKKIVSSYQSSSNIKQTGFRFDGVVNVDSLESGVLSDEAFRQIKLQHSEANLNMIEFGVKGTRLHHLYPTDIVQIVDSEKFGINSGYYQIEEVTIDCQTMDSNIKLGNVRKAGIIL